LEFTIGKIHEVGEYNGKYLCQSILKYPSVFYATLGIIKGGVSERKSGLLFNSHYLISGRQVRLIILERIIAKAEIKKYF
jgi:hypothetical protein